MNIERAGFAISWRRVVSEARSRATASSRHSASFLENAIGVKAIGYADERNRSLLKDRDGFARSSAIGRDDNGRRKPHHALGRQLPEIADIRLCLEGSKRIEACGIHRNDVRRLTERIEYFRHRAADRNDTGSVVYRDLSAGRIADRASFDTTRESQQRNRAGNRQTKIALDAHVVQLARFRTGMQHAIERGAIKHNRTLSRVDQS